VPEAERRGGAEDGAGGWWVFGSAVAIRRG
jgi:hypothetical protein